MRSLASVVNLSPVPLVERYARGGGGWMMPIGRGYVSQMEAARTQGTILAVVRRLATSTAKNTWRLWTRPASGKKEDRAEVTSHAALDLWNRPNPFMTQRQLIQNFQQHKELTGEGNLVLGTVGKLPIELWPIRPDRIEPVPDPYAFLKGWVYTGPNGDRVPLDPPELIRAIDPDPLDPYRGLSPVKALFDDLDASRLSTQWSRNFYTNSARPGGIIEVDRRLSDPEFDEMRDRWAEQHQGVNKAHRVAIIENGAKWVDATVSQRDMQFVEMDTRQRDKLLEGWGLPKSALGITENVNRANADAGEYLFAKWLIEDRLDAIRDMLNGQLLPLYGKDQPKKYEFDYDSPVPADDMQEMQILKARSDAASVLLSIPSVAFDPDEVLEATGLPEITHEDRPTPALPGSSSKSPPDPIDIPAAPGGPGDPGAPGNDIDAAMRWVVEAHNDGNICDPCERNDGKIYRNRADAYEDYPNGQGFKDCIGAQYGNSCRCKVVKRRKKA